MDNERVTSQVSGTTQILLAIYAHLEIKGFY